jgi:hypothetical protein
MAIQKDSNASKFMASTLEQQESNERLAPEIEARFVNDFTYGINEQMQKPLLQLTAEHADTVGSIQQNIEATSR